jgi:tRNA-specific 2-thiouridylase
MVKNKKTKIIVAMSGGVDSSVAAALLKRAGFDVVGVFMKLHKAGDGSQKLAKQVAKKIGVPFRVINVEKEFKKKVIDYFLREYKAGRTPNPCVVCNKEIKFGILIKKALAMGADFVATGHYVRTSLAESNFSCGSTSLRGFPRLGKIYSARSDLLPRSVKLFASKDKDKDQSYFLWQLNQNQLKHVLFPVGEYTKPEVRKLAEKFDLPTAKTPESQEVCFILNSTDEFLKKYLKEKPGKIIDTNGKILGSHNGFWFYTIGQRKGIGLGGGPYYVVAKDFKNNSLIVSRNQKDLLKKELVAKNVNWISGKKPKFPAKIKAQIRYRTKSASAKIAGSRLVFDKPQKAITPGQSAVFYGKGGELLGGGVIDKSR